MTRIRKDIILAILALSQQNNIICCSASKSLLSSISSYITKPCEEEDLSSSTCSIDDLKDNVLVDICTRVGYHHDPNPTRNEVVRAAKLCALLENKLNSIDNADLKDNVKDILLGSINIGYLYSTHGYDDAETKSILGQLLYDNLDLHNIGDETTSSKEDSIIATAIPEWEGTNDLTALHNNKKKIFHNDGKVKLFTKDGIVIITGWNDKSQTWSEPVDITDGLFDGIFDGWDIHDLVEKFIRYDQVLLYRMNLLGVGHKKMFIGYNYGEDPHITARNVMHEYKFDNSDLPLLKHIEHFIQEHVGVRKRFDFQPRVTRLEIIILTSIAALVVSFILSLPPANDNVTTYTKISRNSNGMHQRSRQSRNAIRTVYKKTIYVKLLSKTKKFLNTREVKDYLITKTGLDTMEIDCAAGGVWNTIKVGTSGEAHVKVHLTGCEEAIKNAVVVLKEVLGGKNIKEKIFSARGRQHENLKTGSFKEGDKNIDQATESADAVLFSWFEEALTHATTTDDRKKTIEEHFSPPINKTQQKHLAGKVLDMLYNTENDELLELYQQYLYGHLSVLDDKIKLMKIEEDKRADRNRKKKAKKRQRKKKEAEATAKQLEETKQKKEEEAKAASKVKQKEHAEAERFEYIKEVSTDDSVCSDHQQEDVDAPTPSDMNATTQEHDLSMATTSKSNVLLNTLSKEANPLPNQCEDVPRVSKCISSTSQDDNDNKSVQENNSTPDTRETNTEASSKTLSTGDVTENDPLARGKAASKKTLSTVDRNENDPLLIFLQSQHQCIKGSVDEFYTWLIKSEDIDSMIALKEAVNEDDYLNDMKVGDGGGSGIKGFKRKAFQRAVREYNTKSTGHSLPQCQMKNLSETLEPPDELVCPISLVLMTNDPVLAADGITYERASIEDWFKKSKAKGNIICSPVHGTKLKNLALTPNIGTRNMARAFKERV